MMPLVGLVMPGAFRKQSQQHIRDFKAFAEHGQDVRDAKDRSAGRTGTIAFHLTS
jgi:hypothetical protein